MSYNDDLMKAARDEEKEFNRPLEPKDDILLMANVIVALNGWHEFMLNWKTRKKYLRAVPTPEQQARLDYWDNQIRRHDGA